MYYDLSKVPQAQASTLQSTLGSSAATSAFAKALQKQGEAVGAHCRTLAEPYHTDHRACDVRPAMREGLPAVRLQHCNALFLESWQDGIPAQVRRPRCSRHLAPLSDQTVFAGPAGLQVNSVQLVETQNGGIAVPSATVVNGDSGGGNSTAVSGAAIGGIVAGVLVALIFLCCAPC